MPPKAELPEERVMISYELDDGGALKKVVLPFKVMLTGDYSGGSGKDRQVPLDKRQIRDINEENLDSHIKDMGIELNMNVANYAGSEGDEMNVSIPIEGMKSFSPDSVVKQVPMLRNLLRVRDQLQEISARAANEKDLLRQLEKMRSDPQARKRLDNYQVPEFE
ncbi:type VI secretion system contractile sheath small subunit [bacterium]|nr:type VI secretion system contractile sheath small subunit [candidate division CSSED10-310 bacterium]